MRRKRLISTGVAGLLCGLATLATLALGAPQGPPAGVPVGHGQVDIGLDKGADVLDLPNAAIGDHKSGSVVVSNAGRLAADFALAGDLQVPSGAQGVSALTSQLQLVVSKSQAGGPTTQLYSGSVSGFNAAGSFALGTLQPRQGSRTPKELTLNFQLSFPSTGSAAGDNALQNLGPIDQRFRIEATQANGASASNRAVSVSPKRASASRVSADLLENGAALGLLALAAALLLAVTLPPRTRGRA
jgi:hypothetical protein